MSPRISLVLGRPPGPASVMTDVVRLLREAGAHVVLEGPDPDGADLLDADLVVLKDLPARSLQALAAWGPLPFLTTVQCLNPPAAALDCLDKDRVWRLLSDAGVPVPASRPVASWDEVRTAAAAGPVVVKPREGEQGEGVLLLAGPAPAGPVGAGPWLVQERVTGDALDRKLYVVGDAVLGVQRTWPAPADRSGTAFEPDADLTALARAAAAALGLEVCGVDVLVTPAGPVVVDVNAFPGFKGVPGAAERLAAHLLARCLEEVPCASS